MNSLFANCAAALLSVTALGADTDRDRILLTYSPFDPLRGEPFVPVALRADAGNELYLVQFRSVPTQSTQQQITSAGGAIERYVADWTLVVRMAPGAADLVRTLPVVRWVGPYHPAYRADESVLAYLQGASPEALARFSIETMRAGPAQQQSLADLIAAMGGAINVLTPDQHRMEATLTPSQLLAVIRRNEVNFIDRWLGPPGADMDIIRQYGGAVPILSGAGILGQGVRGEVFDTEVQVDHPAWNGQAPLIHGVNGNSGAHGSAVYGICFATGVDNPQSTGMLPQREQGIFYWYPQSTQFGGTQTRLAANTEATNPLGPYRSVFQVCCVGSPQVTTYTTVSAETDDFLFKVDYLSTQSQTNLASQQARPQAWAKNIVSVAGFNHGPAPGTLTKTDDAASGSSFGYATDGRMKPEMCHADSNIFTTYPTTGGGGGYTQFSGTSASTPIVGGHFGLLMQMWHEGVWSGFGGAATVFDSRPKSTTARALMIAAAFRYDWAPPSLVNGFLNPTLERRRQAWGLPDVGRLYQMRDRTFIVNETDVLTAAQTAVYQIAVAPGEQQLSITMVYADPAGNPAVQSQHRINNLDLRVTAPDDTFYLGNWGLTQPTSPGGVHSNWSAPNGNPDTKNTVENVFVFNPAPGVWTVEVIATELVQDGRLETPGVIDADFGLAVVGGVEGAGCYPDCNADGLLTVADFGCFQTRFVVGDPYADCTQDGGLTVADFGCFQTAFVAGCP